MQQSTIFAILIILLNKRRVSRDYLAERFSISKRTVSRYLAVLEDAGVPITSTPGRGGGVALSDDYTVDKSYLSEAEIYRLRDALARTDGEYSDNANTAIIEKLDCLNKTREQESFTVRQDDLYIDCEYETAAAIKPKIKILSQAIEQLRTVDIKYTDANGFVSFREIEPYTLVFRVGYWYVYAMCKLRGEFRLFKLSRINDLRKTSKRFVRTDSRLLEKLELEYGNELFVDLELEFFPTVRDSIVDWLGLPAVTERGTKLVASAEVPMNGSLLKKLLSFGSSVKVLGPPELREKVAEEAKRLYDVYRD